MQDDYFDHEADIGIIGRGKTIEECFSSAAHVMFSIMSDLSDIHPISTFSFIFDEPNVELALVTWLNLLLAKSNAKNIIFSQFKIIRQESQWIGEASGEQWNENMERGTDVKGATLTMLSVKKINDEWEARCIVDV
ncbi:MAG: Protein archease [Gammaproteobacteria bacterium]|jgi:SHS2 domain-containing protein|nr:Protein archease [Gammaproteobacteria bacterium]